MVAVSFGTALVVIDGAIAGVALPTIARDLRVESASVVAVVTVYQLFLVMLLLPFAGLAERIGVKRMYQGGQIVFTIATILCLFAESLPFLLIVRGIQAIGAAAVLSVTSAMVRAIYPRSRLGRGLGLNGVIVSSSARSRRRSAVSSSVSHPGRGCSPARCRSLCSRCSSAARCPTCRSAANRSTCSAA